MSETKNSNADRREQAEELLYAAGGSFAITDAVWTKIESNRMLHNAIERKQPRALRVLVDFATDVLLPSGDAGRKPMRRGPYEKCRRRQRSMVDFVVQGWCDWQISIPPMASIVRSSLLPWGEIAPAWNAEHPHDVLRPDTLRREYYRARWDYVVHTGCLYASKYPRRQLRAALGFWVEASRIQERMSQLPPPTTQEEADSERTVAELLGLTVEEYRRSRAFYQDCLFPGSDWWISTARQQIVFLEALLSYLPRSHPEDRQPEGDTEKRIFEILAMSERIAVRDPVTPPYRGLLNA